MSESERLDIQIEANVGGIKDAENLANAVSSINEALQALLPTVKQTASSFDKIERGAAKYSKKAAEVAKESQTASQALKEQAEAAKAVGSAFDNIVDRRGIGGNQFTKQLADAKALTAELEKQRKQSFVTKDKRAGSTVTAENQAEKAILETARQRTLTQDQINAKRKAEIDSLKRTIEAEKQLYDKQMQRGRYALGSSAAGRKADTGDYKVAGQVFQSPATVRLEEAQKNYRQAADAIGAYNDRLANTRYALYSLTTSLAIAGVALGAMNIGVIKIGADMETLLANIQRTSETSGAEFRQLSQDFIALGQSIPTSFSDLGAIAALAGQLGVPAARIADFTETVAKFTATTDVSVDAAATAFGRLDTLLPEVQGNYEALGSSILNVGVNSVATESEIISTTNQIAAAGAQAGLTADEVIGLAASFASLGIAPESARGTVIRTLATIRSAVLEGGDALDTLAELSGQTAQAFRTQWSEDTAGAIVGVLEGLGKQGQYAELTLRGLGITAVRDIRALLALSQNVGVVEDNLGYAADGFANATKLGDSFAVIAETLNARFQVLMNSLQAFIATLGSSGLSTISEFVDGLTGLVNGLQGVADNKIVQSLVAVVGAMTAVSAVMLLAGSGFGRFVATALSARPVIDLFTKSLAALRAAYAVQVAAAAAAGTSTNGFVLATKTATTAVMGLGSALKAAGIFGAITLAFTGITLAVDRLSQSMRSGADIAKELFGSYDMIADTLRKDTEIYNETGEALAFVSRSSEEQADAAGASAAQTAEQAVTFHSVRDAGYGAGAALDEYTFAIGRNTVAQIANKLATDESLQKAQEWLNKIKAETGLSFDLGKYIGLQSTGQFEEAQAMFKSFYEELSKFPSIVQEATIGGSEMNAALNAIGDAGKAAYAGVEQATLEMNIATEISGALGVSMDALGDEFDSASDSSDTLSQRLNVLRDSLAGAFAMENAASQMAQDFYKLAEGIALGGNTLNAFTEAGQGNLANLQAAIASTIAAGQTLGISASESVAILFTQLQQQGVDTANLMSRLAGIAGVSVKSVEAYLGGSKQMTQAGQVLNQSLTEMRERATAAAAAVGSGGGGGGGGLSDALDETAESAEEAAEAVRTLADYVSDLQSVLDRTNDLRYGTQNAQDAITKSWQAIEERVKKANDAIREAQATMRSLAADKKVQEYFLKVAVDYGDDLRADQIRADIGKINDQMKKESDAVKKAQQDASLSLVGNSKSAIDNRAELQKLVEQYQDYALELINSGLEGDALDKKLRELEDDFVRQATKMGFNREEIKKYQGSFRDLTAVIDKVPKNITVKANPNPALQALAEFAAKAEERMRKSGQNAGKKFSDAFKGGTRGLEIGGITNNTDPWQVRRAALEAAIAARAEYVKQLAREGNASGAVNASDHLDRMRNDLRYGNFWTGGYTGDVGKRTTAGYVHGKEFVIDAENTARLGLPFLNALNNGGAPAVGVPSAGLPSVIMVELSPFDRQLLSQAGNVTLMLDGKQLTAGVNSQTINTYNLGGN